MKPSYVLVNPLPPSQYEIDVAAEFGIPIRYLGASGTSNNTNTYSDLGVYDQGSFTRN